MNTWGSLKSEIWKIFRKLAWGNLKLDNLKEWLIYKDIKFKVLDDQYFYRELAE